MDDRMLAIALVMTARRDLNAACKRFLELGRPHDAGIVRLALNSVEKALDTLKEEFADEAK